MRTIKGRKTEAVEVDVDTPVEDDASVVVEVEDFLKLQRCVLHSQNIPEEIFCHTHRFNLRGKNTPSPN